MKNKLAKDNFFFLSFILYNFFYFLQVDLLYGNIEDVQSQLKSVTSAFKKFRNQAQETLRQLQFDRQSVSTELVR
jgi:hypothetical protein